MAAPATRIAITHSMEFSHLSENTSRTSPADIVGKEKSFLHFVLGWHGWFGCLAARNLQDCAAASFNRDFRFVGTKFSIVNSRASWKDVFSILRPLEAGWKRCVFFAQEAAGVWLRRLAAARAARYAFSDWVSFSCKRRAGQCPFSGPTQVTRRMAVSHTSKSNGS